MPEVELPNAELISQRRQEKFAEQIAQQLEASNLDQYRALLPKLAPQGEEALRYGNIGGSIVEPCSR
ncbi:hypothetical protein ACVXG7_24215 [Enterobacter hormaechei]